MSVARNSEGPVIGPLPGDLLDQADDLLCEAGRLESRAEELRAEAYRLQAQAARAKEDSPAVRTTLIGPKDRNDPLVTAAGLAVEDMAGAFHAKDVAKALGIADVGRAARLLVVLRELGLVRTTPDGWLAMDPMSEQVRDAVIELGEFTLVSLGAHMEVVPQSLVWYLDELYKRDVVEVDADGDTMRYREPGPERLITRRQHRQPPERDKPAFTEILSPRGITQRLVNEADRRQKLSQPGVRHKIKMKDAAYERQQRAKEDRSKADKAKGNTGKGKGKARR